MKSVSYLLLVFALLVGVQDLCAQKQGKGKTKADPIPREDSKKPSKDKDNAYKVWEDDLEDEDEDADVDRADTGRNAYASKGKSKGKGNSDDNASDNHSVVELEALRERDRLAKAYQIRDSKKKQALLKACRKYFKARELLVSEHRGKGRKAFEGREKELQSEYSRELRDILPQS